MKPYDEQREREVAVLEAAAAIADMVEYGGKIKAEKETFELRLEQLRRAVFTLRDTCGVGPLRVPFGALAKIRAK